MAWSDAARKAAAEMRRRRALQAGDQPPVFKGVFWRAGPTNNPTGSGIRFGSRRNAAQYVSSPGKERLSRYFVKIKRPLIARNIYDASARLGLAKSAGDANQKLNDAMQRASKKGNASSAWMALDRKLKSAASKKGHGGMVFTDSIAGARRKQIEVVAFKRRGSVREIMKKLRAK